MFLEEIKGISIDSPHTKVIDDVIFVEKKGSDYRIQISVPDLRDFFEDMCIKERVFLLTRYVDIHSRVYKLFPDEIYNSMSLNKGKKVQSITFDIYIPYGEYPEVRAYESICTNMAELSMSSTSILGYCDSFTKNQLDTLMEIVWFMKGEVVNNSIGREMLSFFLREINILITQLALENRVPIIYQKSRKLYSIHPYFHQRIQSEYASWTSPLRKLTDCVNIAMLMAFIQNKPYPYSKLELRKIADNTNNVISQLPVEKYKQNMLLKQLKKIYS